MYGMYKEPGYFTVLLKLLRKGKMTYSSYF
jgi:hypothetical protein